MANPMMAMMMNMMAASGGAAGGGGGGGKKDSGKRQRLTTAKLSGTIKDWKGSFGWIKPSQPYVHEKANKKHQGDIYVAMSDVPKGKEMKAGTSLQFHVYADKSGLGAEDISM